MSPEEQGLQTKAATQKELSDMDYLKSKMVQQAGVSSEDEDEEEGSPASPVLQKSTIEAAAADKVRVQL